AQTPEPVAPAASGSSPARARGPRPGRASPSRAGRSAAPRGAFLLPVRVHHTPRARDEERLAVVGAPAARFGGPRAGLGRARKVAQVADVAAERRQAPEEDGLGVAHRRAPGAREREAAAGRHREPARLDRLEVRIGRPGHDGRDLLDEGTAADTPAHELRARRAVRRRLEDAVEAARAEPGRLRPPPGERRRLARAGVLVLENLLPALPALHLPEVHDARPVAGRPRLLPGPDQDAGRPARPARLSRAGVPLVGLGPGADDVDRLVQVELRVRHSGAQAYDSRPRAGKRPCLAAQRAALV